jgi:hypothetical protein
MVNEQWTIINQELPKEPLLVFHWKLTIDVRSGAPLFIGAYPEILPAIPACGNAQYYIFSFH